MAVNVKPNSVKPVWKGGTRADGEYEYLKLNLDRLSVDVRQDIEALEKLNAEASKLRDSINTRIIAACPYSPPAGHEFRIANRFGWAMRPEPIGSRKSGGSKKQAAW